MKKSYKKKIYIVLAGYSIDDLCVDEAFEDECEAENYRFRLNRDGMPFSDVYECYLHAKEEV